MKKIFWTSIFRIGIVFLFWSYVRLFDHDMGNKIGEFFGKKCPICLNTSSTGVSGLEVQLASIQTQLNDITQRLSTAESELPMSSVTSPFATQTDSKVALYYFNQKEDSKLPPEKQINTESLLPVYRIFPATENILKAAIEYLIQWTLTAEEKKLGFVTEFPHKEFHLLSTDIDAGWILTLEFTEVPGFTDGGSARMLIMANSIIKTAKQFPGVKKVVFVPETLFQP